jgi:nucleotide-binding universal stress UspA family protein
MGLNYEFILREGNIWEQLSHVMETKHVEAVVVGTHGRNGLGRLVLGSVAEQIFRSADCLVLTVGPSSPKVSRVEKQDVTRPFLLASDFGAASLGALPQAASLANHFGAKLIVLHVFPACPVPGTFHWSTAGDLVHMQEQAELAGRRQFEELILPRVPAGTEIEFLARFGVVSDQILLACRHLKADLLVVGLNHSEHIETASHLPWATAHKIVCAASCPVLTVKSPRTQSAGVQRSLATQLDRRPP